MSMKQALDRVFAQTALLNAPMHSCICSRSSLPMAADKDLVDTAGLLVSFSSWMRRLKREKNRIIKYKMNQRNVSIYSFLCSCSLVHSECRGSKCTVNISEEGDGGFSNASSPGCVQAATVTVTRVLLG